MKRASSVVLAVFLASGLALAQTGGDKAALNPQPLPPGKVKTESKTAGKKGHKGGKKSKKASSTGTSTTPPPK